MTEYAVIDYETGRVLAVDQTLHGACEIRDALTTLGDPRVVAGSHWREGDCAHIHTEGYARQDGYTTPQQSCQDCGQIITPIR
jgi:hypothetical protein